MIVHATYDSYDDLIQHGFSIVDFYTITCGPCKLFSRILENVESELPFLQIVKVNLTDYPKLGARLDIEAVPTIFFVKDGKLLDRSEGVMDEAEVKAKISQYYYG